jgi:16S rRNA (uracil1498-N3)-methyltransferase
MNIIILTKKDRLNDDYYHLNDERYLHIRDILKLSEKDFCEIGLLNGPCGKASVKNIDSEKVILKIDELYRVKEPEKGIEIICALPRPQTLKKVLSNCATMGVSKISLIRSEKVEKSYFQSPLLEKRNYDKYLIEGLSQGKRTLLPEVDIHKKFKPFFENRFPENNSVCILAIPEAENYLSTYSLSNKNLIIAIGPEAGWNEFEINFMKNAGFTEFKLSENTLRVENAVVSVLAQIELLRNTDK